MVLQWFVVFLRCRLKVSQRKSETAPPLLNLDERRDAFFSSSLFQLSTTYWDPTLHNCTLNATQPSLFYLERA